MKTISFVSVLAGSIVSTFGSGLWTYPYLHYMQCDPQWGNDVMGTNGDGERATICLEGITQTNKQIKKRGSIKKKTHIALFNGCAMTSVAIALSGLDFDINATLANPGTLNEWLETNNGYLCMDGDCNDLNIPIIDNLTNGMLRYDDSSSNSSLNEVRRGLDAQDTIFIAHIPSLSHFVFCLNASWTGSNAQQIQVLDPYFNTTSYNVDQIGSFIVYGIYNVNRTYTYYAQCDKAWANDVMGQDNDTICQVGCLMTSVSMALHSWNIPIPLNAEQTAFVESTPATLNQWLQANNGYVG
ncbi:hypothetical protein RFI_23552 [Reticulomyxa filosa]|uniref:Peptidase C39-like domain-containing protein n=1 Tax=Reticulomyxa filosa TaxID=46433 RepID=X6ML71_RETFI|nr:hypothetical protein RFI_23552 [Reticulomyxa filosa]|eukprot:ETO13815.1 hypothetical protein RFI_23552 [Reticulomyxa filosa]